MFQTFTQILHGQKDRHQFVPRLISKYSVARCRKPQNEKQAKNNTHCTRFALILFLTFPAYLVVLLGQKDGLLLRQASSLVSVFFFGVREIPCVQVRAKAEFDLRFAFACFYLLLYHKRKSCPTKTQLCRLRAKA